MKRSRRSIAVLGFLAAAVGGCSPGVPFDDPFAEYTQRTILVSTGGGDAQASNLAIQTATPWPRYVNNTNIPADGARMAKAIQRYEENSGNGAGGGNGGASIGSSAPSGAGIGYGASASPTSMNSASGAPPTQ
ncbi:MAG: hypothetical protein JO312_04950 [Hyphomicrobiales bacterium]|nr:hypothetical protein [Hyphomicrobiales bacterium]